MLFILFNVNAQNYKQQYNEQLSKNDTIGRYKILNEWAKAGSNDPEMYIAYFNYYVDLSKTEVLQIGQNPKGEDVLKLMNKDSATNEAVAYLYSNTNFNSALLNNGFDWISKGIKMYPDRLDMRLGKIYMYGQIEDYGNFTSEIINTIDYSNEINNNWKWAEENPLENPKDVLLSSIQTYQNQLYNTENDSLLENMKRISETVLKYYPDHIESLSNISIVCMIQSQYDKALELLLKAEKINPKDFIVLNNIAQAYKLKGDKTSSIKYYKLVIKYGDAEAKSYAKEQISNLK